MVLKKPYFKAFSKDFYEKWCQRFLVLTTKDGVGFALLLPIFFGLDGVLYSMPVSDALTAVISAVLIVKTYKQLSMPVAKA